MGVQRLDRERQCWHQRMEVLSPGVQFSGIDYITLKMLGSPDNPKLGAKAAESIFLVGFVAEQLSLFETALGVGGSFPLRACRELQNHYTVIRTADRVMQHGQLARALATCLTTVRCAQAAG